MIINHLGQSFDTIHYDKDLTTEECNELRELFLKLPDIGEVEEQFRDIKRGNLRVDKIVQFYLRDIMNSCTQKGMRWSIEEFLQCDDLLRFVSGKVKNNPKFYGDNPKEFSSLSAVLRLSPSGTAQRIPNFPFNSAKHIIKKYNTNNHYFDYSCGWGVRLLASLANNINYYGVDPNYLLTEKLQQIGNDYLRITKVKSTALFGGNESVLFEIKTQGSEIFIPEYENKMGLAFSSPPYYDKEIYKIGQQSIHDRTYKQWLDEYWTPTVQNIFRYLTSDGNFLLNMKNGEYPIADDMHDIIEQNGFKFKGYETLKNNVRPFLNLYQRDANEDIMIFTK